MATFRIVPERSVVSIAARSSLHPINGEAHGLEGSVDLSTGLGGRIELPVASLRSGNPLYDAEMHRRVDARRHPTIVGEVVEATPLDDPGRWRILGDLTFHGVTRQVEGEVSVEAPDPDTLVIEGEHVFDVRDFGVRPPRIGFLRVHPDVNVAIRIEATRTS
jgi:polyisoprenoid-binding protein YceI